MAAPRSAGILLFRHRPAGVEVLLIHPGGPYWAKRDAGAWMIPKGGIAANETAAEAALREFREETGADVEAAPFPLCRVRQAGGKTVEVFAAEGEFEPDKLHSLHFDMEWPPRSGRFASFPEADAARWMSIDQARALMLPSQLPVLDALLAHLKG